MQASRRVELVRGEERFLSGWAVDAWPVIALTALALGLRFASLDAKSFWLDEAFTVELIEEGLGGLLAEIRSGRENTPPLYFALAWLWAQAFGTGEVGLRSLSALAGTALVPITFAAAASLVSRRAALVAAALIAVNPFLIWYSQEARSYSLFAFFGALSFLCFVRATAMKPKALAGWAVSSSFALATHYFAFFLIAAEAVLLLAFRKERKVVFAVVSAAAVAAGLVPLALEQRSNAVTDVVLPGAGGAHLLDLLERCAQLAVLAVGFEARPLALSALVAVGCLAVGAVLLVRCASARDRRGALIAGAVGGATIAAPLLLAIAGVDYLLVRNLIVAIVPLVIVAAAGFAAPPARLGLAAAGILGVVSLASAISTASTPKYGVEDWRAAAEALDSPPRPRVVLVVPPRGESPLRLYVRGLQRLPPAGAKVRELAVVALAVRAQGQLDAPSPPRALRVEAPVGFRPAERQEGRHFTLLRFRALGRRRVRPEWVRAALWPRGEQPAVLLESPPRPRAD